MSTSHTTTDTTETVPDVSIGQAFGRVFALFHNKVTGLALILSMALLTLIGTLLPQAPSEVRGDPAAYGEWVTTMRPRFGGWTGVIDRVGFFQTFSSWWFRSVVILLALSIIACTVHRAPLLWSRAMHPHLHVSDPFFTHAGLHRTVTLPVAPGEATEIVRNRLSGSRFRVVLDPRGEGLRLYADKHRFAPFGTVLAHTSFVVILLGVLITSNLGFRQTSFPVLVGGSAPVGHDTGLVVEATDFTDAYYPDGRPKDYASDLVVRKDGAVVASQTVRVNSPLRVDGVKIHQASFGIAAEVTIKDKAGTVVWTGGVPLEWTTEDETNSYGKVAVPGTDFTAYVVTAASGQVKSDIPAGQAHLEIYTGDSQSPIASDTVVAGKGVTAGDYTYTFVRERRYTGLSVVHDPGAIWIWIGSGLMMAGLLLTFGLRHRRIWTSVHAVEGGSEVTIASAERHDRGFELWFTRFVDGIADAPTASATTHHEDHGKVRS